MLLTEEEYELFYNAHTKLIYYTGIQAGIFPKTTTFEQFKRLPFEKIAEASSYMYENTHFVDDYLKAHSNLHTKEEIEVINDFKKYKKGVFYIMQLTKKHAVFMDNDYAYAVMALSTPFDYFFEYKPPYWVEAILLPFRGKIVYDGLLNIRHIRFGKGAASSLKNDLNLKLGKHGLITSLPIESSSTNKETTNENLLLAMMKTKESRAQNRYEIEDLLEDNPSLYPIYNAEFGKIYARAHKKELKAIGVKGYHFASYLNTIICSAKTLKEVEQKVKEMIKDKATLKSIYYFKM